MVLLALSKRDINPRVSGWQRKNQGHHRQFFRLSPAGATPEMGTPSGVMVGHGAVMGSDSFDGRGGLNGVIPHTVLAAHTEKSAAEVELSLRRHAAIGLLRAASYVQLINGGTPSIEPCGPTRYTEIGLEMCSLDVLAGL